MARMDSERRGVVKAVSLEEEIEHAKGVIEMYRNSWFVQRVFGRGRIPGNLRWAGDSVRWRDYLCAHATLRKLRLIKQLRA